MTDQTTGLALRDATIPTPYGVDDPTGGRLIKWAEGLAAAHRIGSALCQTTFVPVHFRGKPEEAAAAILYGDEIGFSPTMALQQLYVIGGKPALYARGMVALVMAAGHAVWTVEKTDTSVTVAGRRRGTENVLQETWTIERATKAQYTKNARYQLDPQSMLYARAASDLCRQIAPDVLAGVGYSVEEMELNGERVDREMPAIQAPQFAPVVAPPQSKPAAQDAPIMPQAVDATAVDANEQDVPAETGELLSADQRGALFASFSKAGFSTDARTAEGKAARLAYLTNTCGREITSTNDLTRAEASRVIEALKADAREMGAQE